MEFSVDTIITVLTLLIGGGTGGILTWQWQRKKAEAEAALTKAEADKAEVGVYQQLITDLKEDREYQRTQMEEVRRSADQYKQERDELRKRLDKYDDDIRTLKNDVARNGRMVQAMRPFLCGRANCPHRINVTLSTEGENNDSCTQ